jgi:hypothetical protein
MVGMGAAPLFIAVIALGNLSHKSCAASRDFHRGSRHWKRGAEKRDTVQQPPEYNPQRFARTLIC